MAFTTGARLGELMSLRRKYIDLKNGLQISPLLRLSWYLNATARRFDFNRRKSREVVCTLIQRVLESVFCLGRRVSLDRNLRLFWGDDLSGRPGWRGLWRRYTVFSVTVE